MLERFTPQRVARRARRDAIPLRADLRARRRTSGTTPRGAARRPDRGGLRAQGTRRLPRRSIQRVFNRLVIALIVTGGLIGSSMIGIFATAGPHLLGVNVLSIVGFALSAVLGPVALVRRRPQRPALIRRPSRRRSPGRPSATACSSRHGLPGCPSPGRAPICERRLPRGRTRPSDARLPPQARRRAQGRVEESDHPRHLHPSGENRVHAPIVAARRRVLHLRARAR